MLQINVLLFTLFVVCTVSGDKLQELTLENFDSVVNGEKFVLVLSYVPWDNSCKRVIAIMEEVADIFAEHDDVVLAKINTYEEVKLSTRLWLGRYPEFKFFLIGSTTPETYKDKVRKDNLVNFVKAKSQLFFNKDIYRNSVIELDTTNFERIVKDRERNILVYFYTEWCQLCKSLDTTFYRVGHTFRNEAHCVLARVDGDQNYELGVQNEIPHFPTLKFFSKHNKDGIVYPPGRLNENYSEQNLTKFLNFACKTERNPAGSLGVKAGRIPEFDKIVERFMNQWRLRDEILQEAQGRVTHQNEDDRVSAQYYTVVMKKIVKDGTGFVRDEVERLDRMRDGPLHPDKADEFDKRKNILKLFLVSHVERDEL